MREQRVLIVEALNKSIDAFTSHDDNELDDMMACGLKPLAEAMDVNRIAFYHLTENDGGYPVQQLYCLDSTKGVLPENDMPPMSHSQIIANWFMTAANGLGYTKKRSELSKDEILFMDSANILSLFIVTVYRDGKLWGGVAFQDCVKERDFDEDCLDLYQSVARLSVSTLIQTKRIHSSDDAVKRLQRHKKSVEMLLKTAVVFFSRNKALSDDMMAVGIGLIADMVKVNNLSVWRNHRGSEGLMASQVFCWNKAVGGITAPLASLQNVAYAQFDPLMEELFSLGEPVICPSTLLPDVSVFRSFDVKSICFSPVLVDNAPWGFVSFANSRVEQHFDDTSVELMQSAAFMIANAVLRNEMEREITAKNELNRAIFESAPIGLFLFDEKNQFIDCNEKVLEILDTTKQHYLEHYYDLSPGTQSDGSKSWDKSQFLMNQTIAGKKLKVEWMYSTPAGKPVPCELTLTRIKNDSGYIGLGFIYDLRNIKSLEQELGSAIDKSYCDAITGINNRWFFEDNVKRCLKSLSRPGNSLSLLMIDIDYFKQFNDTYGHLEGDRCLALVANAIKGTVTRVNDFVARYGGEEFVVVLPNTDENGARVIAEKLHENIRKCNIPHVESNVASHVTISIGCATGHVDRQRSERDYIKHADEMLYISKQQGRNRSSFCALDTPQR